MRALPGLRNVLLGPGDRREGGAHCALERPGKIGAFPWLRSCHCCFLAVLPKASHSTFLKHSSYRYKIRITVTHVTGQSGRLSEAVNLGGGVGHSNAQCFLEEVNPRGQGT